jgi:hypothetical protein
MLAHSSISHQLEEKAICISAAHEPPSPAKCEAAPTSGGRFYSCDFSADERQELRTLLFAFLTDGEVREQGTTAFNPKDGSPISTPTSDEFDSSDETATTDSDLSDAEFSDEFSDDDAD